MRKTCMTLLLVGVCAFARAQDEGKDEKKDPPKQGQMDDPPPPQDMPKEDPPKDPPKEQPKEDPAPPPKEEMPPGEELKPPVVVEPTAPAAPVSSRSIERMIRIGGANRTYRLHLPPNMQKDKPVPLVLCLHGAGGSGAIQELLSGMDAVADEKGFAVAYPDGRLKMWVYVGPSGDKTDVGFLSALIDELVREGTADSRRVYSTGISNGAYMTNKLALDIPNKLAACAAVAGSMPKIVAKLKQNARPMPFLYFHGTDDKIVGYDGTDFLTHKSMSLGAEDCVKFWADRDGCGGEPKVEAVEHKGGDDAPSAERWTYPQGKNGAEVVFYKVKGGGHTWPGGSPQPLALLGKRCDDVDASRVMWDFFSKHELPEKK
jgi:polyhydroxybutyrate depolymerase